MSSFYEPIKRNKLDFFNQKPEPVSGDLKQKVLKDDCRLFSKLFISCQSRECDLLEFFKHENQSFPAALSDGGKLHSCQKSQLASILERDITCPDNKPDATAIVIDGSALVNSLPPRAQRTFGEYAMLDVLPKVRWFCSTFYRTDIVFDVYLATSLKAEARTKRGQGGRRRVTETGRIPPNWHSFLRDDDNKTELLSFLADKIVQNCTENTVVVTQKEDVLCNLQFNVEGLMPCNHEEADTRIFLHAVAGGHKQVIIKANDTDVLVLAVSMFPMLCELGIEKLWISFGQGANHRWIPVQDVCRVIGLKKSKGIPFFHAFTGCDVVSAFRGKGKKAAWQTWNVYPEASPVFTKLSMHPPVIDDKNKKFWKSLSSPCMTGLVRPQTLMLSGSICLPGNKGLMTQYLQLGQLWFNILSELHTRQAVFGVSRLYDKWNLKVLVNGVGSSKITVGKYYGQPYHQLPKAVNS